MPFDTYNFDIYLILSPNTIDIIGYFSSIQPAVRNINYACCNYTLLL